MRSILALLIITAGLFSLSGCTSNPNSPGIQAMQPVNACGPAGSSDAEDCGSNRR